MRHQLESFNTFIAQTLPHIIMENSDITCARSAGRFSHHLQFCNVTVRQPSCREADGFERPRAATPPARINPPARSNPAAR